MLQKVFQAAGLTVAAAAAVTLSGALPASADAKPATGTVVTPQSCQAYDATAWLFTSNGATGYDCTGSHYPNVYAYRFDAGGWSGYLIAGGTRRNFCDWQSFQVSGETTYLYLSPSRESWC